MVMWRIEVMSVACVPCLVPATWTSPSPCSWRSI